MKDCGIEKYDKKKPDFSNKGKKSRLKLFFKKILKKNILLVNYH